MPRRFALLAAAAFARRAAAATGGKPRPDLPPLFLVPSLCGSRIRAWSTVDCAIDVTPGTDAWVNVGLIAAQSACWCECMRLWGPNMSDMPNCTARAAEGIDAIYNLADGLLGMFAHSMSGVIDALVDYGYDPTTLHAMPYDFRLTPELMETRDGYFSSFKARVETQVQRRGQRAVIYGHSMGCKVSAYFFSWLGSQFPTESQRLKWIDDHVGMYVSNGGPLLGSPDIVPTLLVGATMGMPISLKQIREVLTSAGGLAFLAPSPRAAPRRPEGPLPTHAVPHAELPWFKVSSWGDGAVDEAFGPEICCGATSFVAGLEKAAATSGDSLLGDLAAIVRRAYTADRFVGNVFDPKVAEVRPPVDTVIAAYGVGYKTPLATTFALKEKSAYDAVTPPLDTARLESVGEDSYDGLPLKRSGATWLAAERFYETGLEHRSVIDESGAVVAGGEAGGAPAWAKSGDMTVTYASLSVVHDWLVDKDTVDVHSVPFRSFFGEGEVVNGTYDDATRSAVFPAGAIPATEEPRMTIFEARTADTHTEVWEMDKVVHRDSSNNDIFIEHFLRELKEYASTGAAADLHARNNVPRKIHIKEFKPEGDASCYWDYAKATCANGAICEYRYKTGDVHLSQSCRLRSTRGAPPPAPRRDDQCYWDYARAACAFPTVCQYKYHVGDVRLDDSCRLRPNVDYSQQHYEGSGRIPVGTLLGAGFILVTTLAASAYAAWLAYKEDQESEALHRRLSVKRSSMDSMKMD
mmetsp:Transcript_24783/g.76438  ORF Transcript_24783/g.76438 Transcript_24783/m.76438 type:complete len:749 (+) Transcript_24783:340-2586(+)